MTSNGATDTAGYPENKAHMHSSVNQLVDKNIKLAAAGGSEEFPLVGERFRVTSEIQERH